MGFQEPNPRRIANHLNPVDNAILGGIVFIVIWLEPHQNLEHSPTLVNRFKDVEGVVIPRIKIT